MKTLHVVSDTISVHYGPYLQLYLSEYYDYSRKEKKIGRLDNPEGPNGRDSDTVFAYLNKAILEEMYWDVLVLNCGLHDIRSIDGQRQTHIEDYIKKLQ